jgi:hypothetical protein
MAFSTLPAQLHKFTDSTTSCGDISSEDEEQCSTCKNKLHEPEAEVLDWAIEIQFGYSRSKYYSDAVDLASKHTHERSGNEGNVVFDVSFSPQELEEAGQLWELVKRWKSSSLIIDGVEASKKDLTYGLRCFEKYKEADRGRKYCFGEGDWSDFNFIGCLKMGAGVFERGDLFKREDVSSELDLQLAWNNFGRFDDTGVWHFDKDGLRQKLRRQFESNRHCPLLRWEDIKRAIEGLPETVDPATDPDWFKNDHIPDIPTSVYGKDSAETEDAVVLTVSGFKKFVPFEYNPSPPHPSHTEGYIEENLSYGISVDGTSFKDRKNAEEYLDWHKSQEQTSSKTGSQRDKASTAPGLIERVAKVIGRFFKG